MPLKWFPSVNFSARAFGAQPNFIIIHYTECDLEESLNLLCYPSDYPVSAHYVVTENGEILHLVEDRHKAWHAGKSSWMHYGNMNDFSIGIELVHNGDVTIPYPIAQMNSLIVLCKDLMTKYTIPVANILGHSDIAPNRKIDPGQHFDWEMLRTNLS